MSRARPPGLIADLCVALAHKWEPERLFVILTSYMDESGTHGESLVVVLGGFMASARQWSVFQQGLNVLKKRYGFNVLHMKDLKAGKGEFLGWPTPKKASLIAEVGKLIHEDRIMDGVTMRIDRDSFKEIYRSGEKPRKLRLDTEYGFCFRSCLLHFVLEATRRLQHHKNFSKTRLHFVLESGHKNAGDAERIFHEVKNELISMGLNLLGTITFATKSECDELMVADMISYVTYSLDIMQKEGNLIAGLGFSQQGATKGISHLTMTAEGLAKVKAALSERVAQKATLTRSVLKASE